MSGGGGGVIIIQRIIESGQFTPEECTKLHAIKDRSPAGCSFLDAWRVARIVRKRLRKP